MDFRKSVSRISFQSNDATRPLHSRISLISDLGMNNKEKQGKKDEKLLTFINRARYSRSLTSVNTGRSFSDTERNFSSFSRKNSAPRLSIRKSVSYGMTTSTALDQKSILQLIMQNTAEQLKTIIGKSNKTKMYLYVAPEQRFTQKAIYTLEQDVPLKTHDEKMLKVQELIKTQIDQVILFLFSIFKDTAEEMRELRTYETLPLALENIYKRECDDFDILNMKAEEVCAQLFKDIKRIDRETERLIEGNRAISFGFIGDKDKQYFLNLKQLDYIEKYEKSRRALNQYIAEKQYKDTGKYISSMEDKIRDEEIISEQIVTYLELNIEELEQKRDVYPEKLDKECEFRNREIVDLKDDLENLKISKQEMKAELAKRKQEMKDWIIYRTKKEAEDAELLAIAMEEERLKQIEDERIIAEILAEDEFVATLTVREKIAYFDNKKKEAKKAARAAAKAAKAAARAEKRKQRRIA